VEFTGTAGEGSEHQMTLHDAVGGQRFFDVLVERFYARVAEDDVLLPLYPDQVDLGPARERLALFLAQYWGGPSTYSDQRGHPRLRMRHAPFGIGQRERDHWMEAMSASLDQTIADSGLAEDLGEVVRARMTEHFTMAADHLVNRSG
jgi:hemoglobin